MTADFPPAPANKGVPPPHITHQSSPPPPLVWLKHFILATRTDYPAVKEGNGESEYPRDRAAGAGRMTLYANSNHDIPTVVWRRWGYPRSVLLPGDTQGTWHSKRDIGIGGGDGCDTHINNNQLMLWVHFASYLAKWQCHSKKYLKNKWKKNTIINRNKIKFP